MKNPNRNRDIPDRSAVPQPNGPLRTAEKVTGDSKYNSLKVLQRSFLKLYISSEVRLRVGLLQVMFVSGYG